MGSPRNMTATNRPSARTAAKNSGAREALTIQRLVSAIKVLRQVTRPRLFLYRDGEQVRPISVRDVNALLCDVASCKVSLKDFRMLRASVSVVKTLMRTERGESQARRKRQVKQAIQTAADDLSNTVTICRKSYVHEAVIDAFEKDTLGDNAKSPARQILADVVSAQTGR